MFFSVLTIVLILVIFYYIFVASVEVINEKTSTRALFNNGDISVEQVSFSTHRPVDC